MESTSTSSSSSSPSSVMKEKKSRFNDDTGINSGKQKQNDTTDLEGTSFDDMVENNADLDEENSGNEICANDVAYQCQTLHLLVLKANYINSLTADYYNKRNFWLIFLPLQVLAVWTTISGTVFMLHGNGTNSPNDNENTNGNDGNVVPDVKLMTKALLDAIVGSALLITTNISKVLDYSGKSKQHEMIAKQMKRLDSTMEMLANDYGKDDATKLALKEASAKYTEIIGNNENSSPPTQITLAYDHIIFELDLQLSRIATSRSSIMKIGNNNSIVIESDTRDLIERKAYSDLAFLIENSTNYGLIMLPNPRNASNEVMKNIDTLLAKYEDDAENNINSKKKYTLQSLRKSMGK